MPNHPHRSKQPKWQPIETAPKDGTPVLGIGFLTEARVIYWRKDWNWTTKPGNYGFAATHWMPLPSPPE